MTVDLGKPADFPSYGWDNEYGERKVRVPPFWASEFMVTNGEYYEFVRSGGYISQEYWCDDGWAWRTHRNIKWPFFWQQEGPAGSHMYSLRTIFEVVSMPWDCTCALVERYAIACWIRLTATHAANLFSLALQSSRQRYGNTGPVDVNYYEAKAYCRWKSATGGSPASRPYRILTEAEHHVIRHREHNLEAARRDPANDKVMVTSGHDFPTGPTGANINLAYASQNPVDYFQPSQTGHRDTTGSAWEWTEDHFNPLKGFEHHAFYDDFSTPCFDGKHSMIVGGSFISTGDEASVFARFHFRPHFLQHSGFRLVASDHDAPATHLFAKFEGQKAARDAALAATRVAESQKGARSDEESSDSVYETESSLHMYLGLHYPSSGKKENVSPILPHVGSPEHALRFPQRVARLLSDLEPTVTNRRALDIGCAVGGSAFELARAFDRVDAFDFSSSFVQAAKRMQSQEHVTFRVPVEAGLYEEVQAAHEPGTTPGILSKVRFFEGDACRLTEMQDEGLLTTYDGIVMSNLLCRLPDPVRCLEGLPRVVNEGGVALLVTPFSWLPEFTPRSKWLGGFYDPVSHDPIRSRDALRRVMERLGFDKIHEEQVPLVIREHQRKYQYIISEATGWRKVG
jgi:putative 4-mercaptohistidine N1-methyltranferase